jgi:ribose 5-phosphate isomerase RpiB
MLPSITSHVYNLTNRYTIIVIAQRNWRNSYNQENKEQKKVGGITQMKIGVITEISTAHRNADIMNALDGLGHEVLNIGMKDRGEPESQHLSYLETGFLTGLMLDLGRVDFVIGGCGTGVGFINSALCYPNVFAAIITDPLDAWIFPQINAGNCVSLALNKGYGWGAEKNLRFIFEKLFEPGLAGAGFPPERKVPQKIFREKLVKVSQDTHHSMAEIVGNLEKDIVNRALTYPGVWEIVNIDSLEDKRMKTALLAAYNREAK